MRILLLSQFYPPVIGGEERHVHSLAHALAARGHEVAVATLSAGEETDDGASVKVFRLRGTMQRLSGVYLDSLRPHAPPLPDPELVLALRRVAREFRPDVVHAHNWIFYSWLPLRPFVRAPVVMTLHDYGLVCARKNLTFDDALCAGPKLTRCLSCVIDHYGAGKGVVTLAAHGAMRPLVARAVDRYLAVSNAVALENRLEGLPHEVVPNFIPDRLEAGAGSAATARLPDEPFILFVGDLSPHKGLPILLEAYRRLGAAPPLVLIGRRTPATPADLPANVSMFESWTHADVLHAWSRALFGLAPSIWREPCATVLMEGMSFGKPMIATRLGGNTDIIEHGRSGLLVTPEDPDDLASAMDALLADEALRLHLADGARKRIPLFRASGVVSQIERVYGDVLAQTSAAYVGA